jgi:hypothetical protein
MNTTMDTSANAMAGWLVAPPALPGLTATSLWMHAGWSLVLACLGMGLGMGLVRWAMRNSAQHPKAQRLGRGVAVGLAWALALWAWVPGPWGVVFWLGLAFQAPSLLTAAMALYGLVHLSKTTMPESALVLGSPERHTAKRWTLAYVLAGLVLGWVLLLDSFALLPVELYGLGFSVVALTVALACVAVPLALWGAVVRNSAGWWMVSIALLGFATLHLPTGNVWDALLDPWGWLALHVLAVRLTSSTKFSE